ncbi:lyase family protein [Paraburkholderia kirstenboschensis]|uniref:Lyase family protein n=1 Tax=Paraburkholderia kirstenboschensis TaxID=1245436 RepID=A0ABZ0EHN9_9BURK|nr:lyase family protein [Paraburkholderia kirstenboschensis]WOD16728.1 lyase family protein [Paraburkholderia kirstenboschensis]
MGEVQVPADRLWGAQTQRSLQHFSIGHDLIPREMIGAYAILKRSSAIANQASGRLDDVTCGLIVKTCDELLDGKHQDMFPLHAWMKEIVLSYGVSLIDDATLRDSVRDETATVLGIEHL